MELMVVVAIIGALSAVVIPQYLRSRTAADAAVIISETLALAKQCAVGSKSGLTQTVNQPSNGNARACNGQALLRINSRSWSGDATGVECLGVTAAASDSRVRITVATDGNLTCQFF